jgi:membrane-associated protease RseP (regulator of RpoE activity)
MPEFSPAETLSDRVEDEMVAPVSSPEEAAEPEQPRRRRVLLPVVLLLATCLSTFYVGSIQWYPAIAIWMSDDPADSLLTRNMMLAHWRDGLIYMACLIGILLAHEMGHFVATLIYRIPASFPFVIPMPLLPLGTFGAVIGMDGKKADRKQTFDIGIAGPLAGLVICIPVVIWGTLQLDFTKPAFGVYALHNPLLVDLLLYFQKPPGYVPGRGIAMSQLNPFFMAGWVGLLITGLNMLPVSQLDGGHVVYTMFGKRAHWVARIFMLLAIVYLTYSVLVDGQAQWILMVGLILFVGVDHPPTRDDSVPIGWFRYVLGWASLLIPLLCFSPKALTPLMR